MAPPIPDRWLDYKPVGEIIKGTRFIAFKVPLREHVVQSVPSHNRLSCRSLLEKIPNLGMIIDLTNTNRYYDPTCFQEKGVIYQKLMIPGHDVPPRDRVEKFIMLVNNFLRENANNAKLIGVHCTHGANRTGYLIASYMISEMNISPQEAIKSVEEARGHRIERENYRNNLCRKASSGTSNRSHNHDNSHRPNNNTTSQNTSHRHVNSGSQMLSKLNGLSIRPDYNNRPQMASNNQTIDNWRVPNRNNIAPLDSGPGKRNDNSTSGSRQRSSYNVDERQYSQPNNSCDSNERQYSQHRTTNGRYDGHARYERQERQERNDRHDRYDRQERHDSHDRYDRQERHDNHDRHKRPDRYDMRNQNS